LIKESADFGVDSVYRSGAPRSMTMGTTRSPWRYDAAADQPLQSASLRRPAVLRYAVRMSFRSRRLVGSPSRSRPCRANPTIDLMR